MSVYICRNENMNKNANIFTNNNLGAGRSWQPPTDAPL